jgi:hypothetical protein
MFGYSKGNTKMNFRTGTSQGEEYIKVHTTGYPECTLFKGNRQEFERDTGIIVYSKKGTLSLTERDIKALNMLLGSASKRKNKKR